MCVCVCVCVCGPIYKPSRHKAGLQVKSLKLTGFVAADTSNGFLRILACRAQIPETAPSMSDRIARGRDGGQL